MHYEWLDKRFKEIVKWNPEATIWDALVYATVSLHHDLEPGCAEGFFNVYEAMTASDQKAFAEGLGIERSTVWRRLQDFR